MQRMTFAEFQATGRDVADLSTIEHCACSGMEGPGRAYLDSDWPLVIESEPFTGYWYWSVTIGSEQSRFLTLPNAERKLYDFAISEGYIDAGDAP